MRVAFYAPMKAPGHPLPSGDRRMARLLIAALREAGHEVEPACAFSSFDATGDPMRQRRLGEVGRRAAVALSRRYLGRSAIDRPDLWFTYHVYHKAPDWLGPTVSRTLGIPYVVAEASHAPKQKFGPWASGYEAASEAITAADLVFGLSSADAECVLPLLADPGRLVPIKPFIDTSRYTSAAADRERYRQTLNRAHGLDPEVPVLLAVAMMRQGDKLASYRLLGHALSRVLSRPWRLLVVGDGPARTEVETALGPLRPRVVWLGKLDDGDLPAIYAGSDLYVWPAIGEAYGMAFLEAQAAGLPVVGGRTGGVPDVVADGETGRLVPVGDDQAFAAAVAQLLDDADGRRTMGMCAGERMRRDHDLSVAARALGNALSRLATGSPA
jgi:glycosyltransferase involved in cell wall biosynthesis